MTLLRMAASYRQSCAMIRLRIAALKAARAETDRPTAVVCDTVKGKGVSFMEDVAEWHGVAPNHDQATAALEELDRERETIEKEA